MCLSFFSLLTPAQGQEIPRPSQTRHVPEADATRKGNVRVGQVDFDVDAAMHVEFVDNVYLSRKDPASDVLLEPQVGVTAIWPITQRNTLRLNTTFGLTKYLENSALDNQQVTIAPDSALEFVFYTGDFRIGLHDQFSIESETVNSGSLSGVASLPRFTNTAGLTVLWDLVDVQFSTGYDHYQFITLGQAVTNDQTQGRNLSNLDHTTDQFSASTAFVLEQGKTGLEATFSLSNYPDNPSANFKNFTIGPYLNWQLTHYTALQVSGGYKRYEFEGTPQPVFALDSAGLLQATQKNPGSSAQDGYYASLAAIHRLNRYYTDRLELGHEDQVDALSGRTQINYVRYTMALMLNSKVNLHGGAHLDDVQQTTGNLLFGDQADNFRLFGFDVGTGYQLTPRANVSVSYQFTRRVGENSLRDYTQNRISFGVSYNF